MGTRCQLDTFKSTKKYQLNFLWPGGVTISTDPEPEPILNNGVLTCDLLIKDWGSLESNRKEILDIRQNKRKRVKKEKESKDGESSETIGRKQGEKKKKGKKRYGEERRRRGYGGRKKMG